MVLCIMKWVNVLIQSCKDSFRDGWPSPACSVGPLKHGTCCQVLPLLQLGSWPPVSESLLWGCYILVYQCVTNICICISIRKYQFEYSYSYLYSPFFVNPNIFVFVFAFFIQTKYICIHIRPFLLTRIYLYLYSSKKY